ncbi:porin family protein [Pontibacter liquoris]|uniref:porin family protein n=1 Tax=Pontibacter liquoris TaxID=2905677 RepID=UPI001FA6D8CF|nr:porin family protein [Pontibacter liquoris]
MKKLLVMFSFVLATFTAAQAQSGFGVRAGANLSNLSGDLKNENQFDNKIGFHGGITYNFGIVDDFFGIQPELLYSQKGFKNSDEEFEALGQKYRREGKVNYNYLDLPVLAHIKAGPIYFEGGPQASYLLSVNNTTKTYLNDELQNTNVDSKSTDGLKKFELGYAAGVGFTTGVVSLGVRYNGAFSDFVEKDVDYGSYGEDLQNARHSTIMLTLGVTIPSGR